MPCTPHHLRQLQGDPEIIEAFGSREPDSQTILLHYAGPPERPRRGVPVLLVHGAGVSSIFWWKPKSLPQALRRVGFDVYFVTFPHNHDDNFIWTQQLDWALQRVRQLTDSTQVDVVAHSKGGIALALLLTELRQPWMRVSGEGIRKALFVASPLGGVDYSFRHPVLNWGLYAGGKNPRLNAPISWEEMLVMGRWVSSGALSFSAPHWPGQRQILARWDSDYAVPRFSRATYEGHKGIVARGLGIDHYVNEGGRLIERLAAQPLTSEVEIGLLAGDRANVPFFLNERCGPSDGLVFVSSTLAVPPGTRVDHRVILPLNHLQLVRHPRAHRWIAEFLA